MWERIKHTFLEAIDRTLLSLTRLIPGLFVMVVCIAAGLLLAFVLKRLVARLCVRLELDRRLREWGMARPKTEGQLSPSELLERLVKWTVLTLGFVIGLAALESTTASALASALLDFVPRAVIGLFILMAGIAGARALERRVLIEAVNLGLQSARLIGLGVRTLVIVFATAIALERLGLGGNIVVMSFGILFGGIVLALALAIGLGAKEAVSRSLDRRLSSSHSHDAEEKTEQTPMHHL